HFYVKKGGTLYGARASTPLNLNEWTHLAAVWNGTGDGLLRIYINGSEAAQYDFQGSVAAPLDTTGGGLQLGNSASERFEGLMDELAIFHNALSASEIGVLMTDGLGDGHGDACDLCPGIDDHIDADGDGIPDACDTDDPVSIDFDQPWDGSDDYVEDGFEFTRLYGVPQDYFVVDNSNGGYLASAVGIRFASVDRRPFRLEQLVAGSIAGTQNYRIVGYLADGGTVTQDVALIGNPVALTGLDNLVAATIRGVEPNLGVWYQIGVSIHQTSPCSADADGDGVCDPGDACPGFNDTFDADNDGIADGCDPCAGGAGTGDANADESVDGADYAAFNACLNGPDGNVGAGCDCFDFDADTDTDLLDYAEFQVLRTP
ncbi:MAG TPA: LamG domain-containing protein, partial [Phycisphaerae bacterium]|nr:LamG domain-containing protein [Phycisphaerae bacterium]